MLRILTLQRIIPFGDGDSSIKNYCDCLKEHLKLPSSIGNLVHLRFLSLIDSFFLLVTSSSMSNLKQLQTLDIRIATLWITSDALQKLKMLKHLYLPEYNDNKKIEGSCYEFLTKKKLRFDGLHSLELLEGFHNTGCDSRSLSTLTNLRSLTAKVKGNVKDLREFMNSVINLTRLRSSELDVEVKELLPLDMVTEMFSWSGLTNLMLKKSTIKELPEYEVDLRQNLHSLTLQDCRMDKDPMKMLEKLPNLRTLCLREYSYEGKEMACHAMGFPQLTYLYLEGLNKLETWEIEEGALPLLSRLVIRCCNQLKMIPEGLKSITSLKGLHISSMPDEFKARIRVDDNGEEGDDFYKIRHVIIVFSN